MTKKIVTAIIILGVATLSLINILSNQYIEKKRNTFPYWIKVGNWTTCVNRTDKDWVLPSYEMEDSMITVHPGDTVPYGYDGTDRPWPFPDTITVVDDYGTRCKAFLWEGVPKDSADDVYANIYCRGDTTFFYLLNLRGELRRSWKYHMLKDSVIEYKTYNK